MTRQVILALIYARTSRARIQRRVDEARERGLLTEEWTGDRIPVPQVSTLGDWVKDLPRPHTVYDRWLNYPDFTSRTLSSIKLYSFEKHRSVKLETNSQCHNVRRSPLNDASENSSVDLVSLVVL